MIKVEISKTGNVVYLNQDDQAGGMIWFTQYFWNSGQINDIMNHCLGPNKIRMSIETVLTHNELSSMLVSLLGVDKVHAI